MMEKKHKKSQNTLVREIKDNLRASPDLGIKRCIQCGLCTSNCPAARHSDYDPRKMVKKVLDNNMEVLDNPDIWNCFYCYTCASNCPVNNSPSIINQILREKILNSGLNVSRVAEFIEFGYNYIESGVGTIPSTFFQDLVDDFGEDYQKLKHDLPDIRQKLGLEDYHLKGKAAAEVKNILKASHFTQRLEKLKKNRLN